jgi:hypothetical protein
MNANADDTDPFCEAAFWQQMGVGATYVTNPITASTSVLMSVMACVPILDAQVAPSQVPFLFFVAKATVFVAGLGTVAFHSVPLEYLAVNVRFLDWIPIVLMGASAALFSLSHDLFRVLWSSELGAVAACACVLLWLTGSILLMDSSTRPLLVAHSGADQGLMWANALVLLPLLLILLRMVLSPDMRAQMVTGGWYLVAAGGLWGLNSALCRSVPVLFVLHALYHLAVVMAYLHLISIWAAFASRRRLVFYTSPYTWPCVGLPSATRHASTVWFFVKEEEEEENEALVALF